MMRQAIVPKLFVALLLAGIFALLGCEGSEDRSLSVFAYPSDDQKQGDDPVMEYVSKLRVGYFSYEDGTYSLKSSTEFNDINASNGGSGTIKNIPTSGGPYTYVVEGFGTPRFRGMTLCDRSNLSQFGCETGWSCEPDRETGLEFCVYYVNDGVAARGFSPPVDYTSSSAVEAPVMFSRVMDFAVLTLPSGSLSKMRAARFGHKSIALPDGNALVIGGAVDGASDIPSFPKEAEMYLAENNRFTNVNISGDWSGGRSHFALTDLGMSTDETTYHVLVSGGNTSQGLTDEVFLLTYDLQSKAVSAELIGSTPTNLALHTATLISDNRVLIAGGLTETQSGRDFYLRPVNTAFLVNLNSNTISQTAEPLESARFMHTATRTPNDKVMIVGGMSMVNGSHLIKRDGTQASFWEVMDYEFVNAQSIKLVDVYHAASDEFASYNYSLNGVEEPVDQLSRAGHVAIPLYDVNSNSDTGRWAIAIYGGFAYDEFGDVTEYNGNGMKMDTPHYFSTADSQSIDVGFVWAGQDDSDNAIDGMGTFSSVNLETGYNAIMQRANPASPHACSFTEWAPLGKSNTVFLLSGGMRPGLDETSNWGEIIAFSGSAGSGYTMGSFVFGPESSTHLMRTPYRAGSLNSGGRVQHSMTRLRTGQILITGGVNGGESLDSAEIFNPPSNNSWGNRFEAASDL